MSASGSETSPRILRYKPNFPQPFWSARKKDMIVKWLNRGKIACFIAFPIVVATYVNYNATRNYYGPESGHPFTRFGWLVMKQRGELKQEWIDAAYVPEEERFMKASAFEKRVSEYFRKL